MVYAGGGRLVGDCSEHESAGVAVLDGFIIDFIVGNAISTPLECGQAPVHRITEFAHSVAIAAMVATVSPAQQDCARFSDTWIV